MNKIPDWFKLFYYNYFSKAPPLWMKEFYIDWDGNYNFFEEWQLNKALKQEALPKHLHLKQWWIILDKYLNHENP